MSQREREAGVALLVGEVNNILLILSYIKQSIMLEYIGLSEKT